MKKLLLLPLLFIAVISFGQVPNYVPSDSLVGYWGFNGNANDESGNGNDGTVNGATLTTDRLGTIDAAYSFNNSSIMCTNSNIPNNIFSLSVWFYQTQSFGGIEYICLGSSSNTSWGAVSSPLSTNMNYGRGCSGSGGSDINPIVNLNNWLHIVYVSQGAGLNTDVYINGNLVGTAVNSIPGSCSTTNLYFGVDIFSAPEYIDGKLDDIGIWNRALDSCEVKDLYNASLGNCCALNPITSQPTNQSTSIGNNATFSFTDNLIGATYQWQMDAGTGYSDLSNAGQFSGADTDSLIISTTTMGNHNTLYRCIVTESASCMDTTDVSTLTVIDNTSIGELNNSLVQLFPNPSNDIITLTLAQNSNGQLILTDILGKEVLSKRFTSNEVQLNLKSLASKGTYFAKVLDTTGNVIAIKKLIYQ
jgi:hypothetical protein